MALLARETASPVPGCSPLTEDNLRAHARAQGAALRAASARSSSWASLASEAASCAALEATTTATSESDEGSRDAFLTNDERGTARSHPVSCLPCLFWRSGLCKLGDACGYCHQPHPKKGAHDGLDSKKARFRLSRRRGAAGATLAEVP